jgi:protein-disulfide isomerase
MRLAALTALALCLAAPVSAFDIGKMTDAEREALRAEIRAYLLEHPELLIEVSDALEARQAADQAKGDAALIATNSAEIFAGPADFVGGNPEGSLTLVEFLDYRCGYCKKAHAEVADLVNSDGDIRYVVKEFPILGDQSLLASRFAIAALRVAGPEAYQKINAGFYESFRGDVTEAALEAFAKGLGLDPAPILAAMSDPEVEKVVADNHALAQRLQISGTPTFVLGDQMLRGYLPLDGMRAIVEDVRG